MEKRFRRCVEDFVCENCGEEVKGGGYTNHCPKCLWSRDVDINPGDRASGCGGMMRPIAVEVKKGEYVILHKCIKCGKERKNKSAENDDFAAVLALMSAA